MSFRDQARARHAYQMVAQLRDPDAQQSYQTAVNDLGANILRNGLCAALANLQRLGERGGDTLLKHLAEAGIHGLEGVHAAKFVGRVRDLDAQGYILATREALQVATWLKRAARATFGGE